MGIYEDAKTHFSLVSAVALASFAIAWASFLAFEKLTGIERVSANTYVLLKDLRGTYLLRAEHDKEIEVLQRQIAGASELATQFEVCSTSLEEWKTGLGRWKQASEGCHAKLSATSTNCSILYEVRRLEQEKVFLDRDARTLGSSGINGNPNDGISQNNQIKLEDVRRSIHDLEARILEVTKHLSCEQKI